MQNLSHKIYTAFTKVVVLFTRKLAKLVSHFSHFSVNFYAIYKLQEKHKKTKESNFTQAPINF
jgi:hypothetical protein